MPVDLDKNKKNWAERFAAVYVLTTNGEDIYADMTLLSALSLKHSNTQLPIIVCCDMASHRALQSSNHPLLKICDQLLGIQVPEGTPEFQNRWIKTQLPKFVDENVLFMDSDTLVRRNLLELPHLVPEFGAVANENASRVDTQPWGGDREFLIQMGWAREFKVYLNGGIWFYRRSAAIERFFDEWHSLWMRGFSVLGRSKDQPTLNLALQRCQIHATVLPPEFNAQVLFFWESGHDARVWHFYSSLGMGSTVFSRLLAEVSKGSLPRLTKMVGRSLKPIEPWENNDVVSRWLLKSHGPRSYSRVPVEQKLWLDGSRWLAIRFYLGCIKERFISKIFHVR